jgi:non-specific serine/threonine protein kinase
MRQARERLDVIGDIAAAAAVRGHVPLAPAPLLDREREIETARELLLSDTVRLLTLTGPAGVGKTRLALEVAHEMQAAFSDGVWFVDLAPLRDPESLFSEIARVVDVWEGGRQAFLPGTLPATLTERQILLVLDTFEHLLAAAPCVAELLAAGPAHKLLVTSRTRLRLRWEHTLPVAPLSVADRHTPPTVEAIAAVPAVALFVERARASDPAFALTPQNAPAVAALTEHLEGLPLALELAASRANVLAPTEMLRWTERRLPALDGDAPDLPSRHRSLRAAVAWSYGLLPAAAQALFRRLAVFAGGWTRSAAAAIADNGDLGLDPVAELTRLVDASLVQVTTRADGGRRFVLMETLREFAAEQLEASGEAAATRCRHAAYYTALAVPALEGAEQGVWFRRLEREHDNLRAALAWAAERGEMELELRLVASLAYYWWCSGWLREGRAWLADALKRDPDRRDGLRQEALEGAGLLASWLGEDDVGTAWLVEALDLAHALGDGRRVMRALGKLAAAAWMGGHYERTSAIVGQVEVARPAADSWSLGLATWAVGMLAQEGGEYAMGTVYLEESLARCRAAGDQAGVIRALTGLATAAQAQGDQHRATTLVAEALVLAGELGGPPILIWWCGYVTVRLSAAQASAALSAQLLGAINALRLGGSVPLPPHEKAEYDLTIAAVRSALGEEAFATAWAKGQAMTAEQLVEAALDSRRHRGDRPSFAPERPGTDRLLSRREREVLQLMADGATNKQIAAALVVAEATARYHVASLLNKLGATNRTQAVTLAQRQNLL